jgi:hypothetical protein
MCNLQPPAILLTWMTRLLLMLALHPTALMQVKKDYTSDGLATLFSSNFAISLRVYLFLESLQMHLNHMEVLHSPITLSLYRSGVYKVEVCH